MVRVAIAACISAVSADSFCRVSAWVVLRAERVEIWDRWWRWVSVLKGLCVSCCMLCCRVFSAFWRRQRHTFELCDVHAKGVALFEHAFAAALDEVVEALCELGHAFA